MGDAEGQGGLAQQVFFIDENHCGNPFLHAAFEAADIRYEKHTSHFDRGTEDNVWIPKVAASGWIVLTADARIRHNFLERLAVKENNLRLFYFSRNDFSGQEMGEILRKALPNMLAMVRLQAPPFAASLSRRGDVILRDVFGDL